MATFFLPWLAERFDFLPIESQTISNGSGEMLYNVKMVLKLRTILTLIALYSSIQRVFPLRVIYNVCRRHVQSSTCGSTIFSTTSRYILRESRSRGEDPQKKGETTLYVHSVSDNIETSILCNAYPYPTYVRHISLLQPH